MSQLDELREEFERIAGIHVEYIQMLFLPLVEANPKDLFKTQQDDKGGKIDRFKFDL